MEYLSLRRSAGGYSLLEMLLAMAILSFLVMLTMPLIKNLETVNSKLNYDYQTSTAVYQLQVRLACGEIIEVNEDEIVYNGVNGENTLSVVNDSLIIQPGYNCFLHDVDSVSFYMLADVVFMRFEQNDKETTVAIAYR